MADGTERDGAAAGASRVLCGRRWNKAKEAIFFEALAATCNVAHSAEMAGMGKCGAYQRKQRDPAFAAAWRQALGIGFAELEMQLLRQSLNGSIRTETVIDSATGAAKQVKTVHSFPHNVGIRLLLVHREEVERYRRFEAAAGHGKSEIAERVRTELAKVRALLVAEEDEEYGEHDAEG